MDPLSIVFGFILTFLFGAIFFIMSSSPSGQQKETLKKIDGTDFIPTQMLMGNDGLGGIAVNEHSKRVCLLKTPSSSPRLISVSALLGSHLIHNGEILGERVRSFPKDVQTFIKQIQPKIQREIPGLHAHSSSRSNQQIDLLILVHDETDPIHAVNILDMETKEGGIIFDQAINTAKHWHNLLEGLILEWDQQARFNPENEPNGNNGSPPLVADELVKLSDLLDKKLITEQEFETQKDKLLAGKP